MSIRENDVIYTDTQFDLSKFGNFICSWKLSKTPSNFVQGSFSIKLTIVCHKNWWSFGIKSPLNFLLNQTTRWKPSENISLIVEIRSCSESMLYQKWRFYIPSCNVLLPTNTIFTYDIKIIKGSDRMCSMKNLFLKIS